MPDVPGFPPNTQLLAALARLGQATRMEAVRNAGPHNLSPLQADIIALFRRDSAVLRQSDIVTALASTAPTISDAVRVLRKKGLVDATADMADARARLLRLTPAGEAEAERVNVFSESLVEAVETLSPQDLAAILRVSTRLMRELESRSLIPTSRMCPTCRFFVPNAHPGDESRPYHCNFVDAAFGDAEIRVTCPDHEVRS
ncbi:MarR family winged helix-turn-helix transcriptional regulator [Lentzea sp.]|uniref:MarR family winged helix-turn-helix transcriptional regulator n=1 Tax=Lentzea sp. TaxID=56099 RepID=UPI002CD30E4C|nr:MarR family winged helix-turn-helix transcriptional regulator [Lentzea sp.]HUQ55576.1 MarR family winged helix-turn-helix transcriptional regulator [Lentzea sp.]